jgi:hypothetical protein
MENAMSVNESSATTLLRFTGLGIICLNQDRQRGEIAILRDNKHTLSIKLQKPAYQEGADNDIIVYQDIATYENLPKDDVELEIKAIGNPAIAGYKTYEDGDFDRLGDADPNDFRWLVNMGSLHNGAALIPTGEKHYPLTKLYISNGLFYTHKLDTNLFFEKVEKDASGAAVEREEFGNVGETLGVKIEGDAVNFRIRIGDHEETHTLERVAGLPFRIEIKNMDYSAAAVYSDMPDYYRYLASADSKQFDFNPVIEEDGAGGGAVNQEDFCHPIVMEPGSIAQL